MSLETQLNKDSAIDFWEAMDNLLTGIKKDIKPQELSFHGFIILF